MHEMSVMRGVVHLQEKCVSVHVRIIQNVSYSELRHVSHSTHVRRSFAIDRSYISQSITTSSLLLSLSGFHPWLSFGYQETLLLLLPRCSCHSIISLMNSFLPSVICTWPMARRGCVNFLPKASVSEAWTALTGTAEGINRSFANSGCEVSLSLAFRSALLCMISFCYCLFLC